MVHLPFTNAIFFRTLAEQSHSKEQHGFWNQVPRFKSCLCLFLAVEELASCYSFFTVCSSIKKRWVLIVSLVLGCWKDSVRSWTWQSAQKRCQARGKPSISAVCFGCYFYMGNSFPFLFRWKHWSGGRRLLLQVFQGAGGKALARPSRRCSFQAPPIGVLRQMSLCDSSLSCADTDSGRDREANDWGLWNSFSAFVVEMVWVT